MSKMDWITSGGGPLICMEERLKSLWGGIVRLTIDTKSGAENDYDRACQCELLLNSISLTDGNALVFGDEPFNTSFWQAADGPLSVVRVQWAETLTDIDAILAAADISSLQSVEDNINFLFESSELILFDSVEDGRDDRASVGYSLARGRYTISTKIYNPDSLTSLYIHQFVKLSGV